MQVAIYFVVNLTNVTMSGAAGVRQCLAVWAVVIAGINLVACLVKPLLEFNIVMKVLASWHGGCFATGYLPVVLAPLNIDVNIFFRTC